MCVANSLYGWKGIAYKSNYLSMILFQICIFTCTWYCVASEDTNVDVDVSQKPLIIWWYPSLFPHIEEEGKSVYEVECDHNVKCFASRDRSLVNGDEPMGIIMYGTDFRADEIPLPRKQNQVWALLHEESPQNNYILCQPDTLKLFNLSATFKKDSDYPLTTQYIPDVQYLLERKPLSIKKKNEYRKNGLAPVVYLQSHCDVPSDRDRYLKELMKHIKVDSYGSCLHNKDFDSEHLKDMSSMESEELYDILAKYKFHIAFENAICDDYVTEKLFRPFHVGSVPVYKGASNAKEWAPSPRSVIMVDDFPSPQRLANFLNILDKNDDSYKRYLDYKNDMGNFNPTLRGMLRDRRWSSKNAKLPNFVTGFECFVCEQMHKIQRDNSRESRTLPASHLNCPKPVPSLGRLGSLSKKDGFHRWTEDFSQAVYQSLALNDMINNNESDSKSLWEYVSLRMEKSYKHTEL